MIINIFKFILIFFILIFSNLNAKELKKVTIQLSWFDQFQFAGYYMAKEKGYYQDYGLDVEILPFQFGFDIPKMVLNREVDFAVGRETLVLEKVKNKDLTILYALFQATPLVLLSTKESGINSIEDFKNKRVMTTIDDASEVSLKAMMTSKKVDIEELTFLKHTHNINDLIDKNTDVISAYISKAPYELQKKGIKYNVFDPKEFGFDLYSDFLYTSDSFVSEELNVVKAFKEASLKGWEYAYNNISESANLIFYKYNRQNLSKDELIFEGKELKKLSYYNTNTLGEIKPDKVQRIYDLYNILGLMDSKMDIKDFIFDENNIRMKKLTLIPKYKNYIEENKNVNMCVIPNMEPYSFFKDKNYEGFVSDYMKMIEEMLGLSFNLVKTESLSQSLTFLKEKKCDILTMAQDMEDRRDFANFTKPYINIPFVLITKNDRTFIDDISVLRNKKISVVKSYSTSKFLKEEYKNIIFDDSKDLNEGLKKVEKGEVYGHIDLLYTSWYRIYSQNLTDLRISAKLDLTTPVSIAIRKDNLVLAEFLDFAIVNIDKESEENSLKKWVTIDYKKEIDYDILWKVIFIALGLLLAILYRQRLLKDSNEKLKEIVEEKTRELVEVNKNLEKRVESEVEENLKKDRLLAKQSKMAAMGEMIQNIAHQWRQPLSVISTGASGLKVQKEINGKIDDTFLVETLTTIVKTSEYLSKTLDNFMRFFKPNQIRTLVSISTLIERTLSIFDLNLKSEKIEVITNIEDCEIIIHESEFIQILTNILSNSKDAFFEKNIEKRFIFIDSKCTQEFVIIEIKDNAGGISKDIMDKIFEPYFTTKHQSLGTGIGLFMCQEIISKHMNGSIEAENVTYMYESNEFNGALFRIKLKLNITLDI